MSTEIFNIKTHSRMDISEQHSVQSNNEYHLDFRSISIPRHVVGHFVYFMNWQSYRTRTCLSGSTWRH